MWRHWCGSAGFQMIEAAIHRQPIQPGSHRGVSAKVGQFAVGEQKDFLKEIFRIGPRAAHSPGQVEQPG